MIVARLFRVVVAGLIGVALAAHSVKPWPAGKCQKSLASFNKCLLKSFGEREGAYKKYDAPGTQLREDM